MATPLFLVTTSVVIPVYDIYVMQQTRIFKDRDEAITVAKQLLYEEVNKSFRNGVEACVGVNFKLSDIENYDEEHYEVLWRRAEEHCYACHKGGPAQVYVYEFTPTTRGPFERKLIYHLPGNVPDFTEESSDEEEEDE